MKLINDRRDYLKGLLILVVLMIVLVFIVLKEEEDLLHRLTENLKESYLESKKQELRLQIKTAQDEIAEYYSIDADEEKKSKAMDKLRNLRYDGGDGYFFVYDLKGKNLVHPIYKDWEGTLRWDLQDCKDKQKYIIQDLKRVAVEGGETGGFDVYRFAKPSASKSENISYSCDDVKPKLGYVIILSHWNVLLGTGIYLDEVDDFIDHVNKKAAPYISEALYGIFVLFFIIAIILYSVQITLGRASGESKEKLRIINLLHNSIEQKLASVIRNLGNKRIQIERSSENLSQDDIKKFLIDIEKNTFTAFQEIIDIRKNTELHEEITLVDGLREEIRKFQEKEHVLVEFILSREAETQTIYLLKIKKKVLLDVCRNSLSNIAKHAAAEQVWISLEVDESKIVLTIRDDGIGFKWEEIEPGIWFKNRDKLRKFGKLEIISIPREGTTVKAIVPQDQK